MSHAMKRIALAARPEGAPEPGGFRLDEGQIPTPCRREFLVRTIWLPLAPYMRGRMDGAKPCADPAAIGDAVEDVGAAEGLEAASAAFMPLLKGGKRLARVRADRG